MAIAPFLAMTAAEICSSSALPPKVAWLACHFSPYGLGLSNLPKELPPGSLLILDDYTPPYRHDPEQIAQQLSLCVETMRFSGVLLDFQRDGNEETKDIARLLTAALPCPTAVTASYCRGLDCPVFLPPVPLTVTPEEYLLPWKGRDIWLELCTDGEHIMLTEKGSETVTVPRPEPFRAGFADDTLHCHYAIDTTEKSARFTLWRTEKDQHALLMQAESLGVTKAIGLFQEIGILFQPPP